MAKLFSVLIISLLAAISCKKETVEWDAFLVTVKNNYFEKLDTVKMADKIFYNLLKSGSTPPFIMAKGSYTLRCATLSKLSIEAGIDIKGSFEKISIIVNESGKISITNN